jgi:hypothetical protein
VQDLQHHATCTLAAASPCILHTQPTSGGVGAFDPAWHLPFLAQSKARRKQLPICRLRVHRKRPIQNRFIAPPPLQSLGILHAKAYRTDINPDQKREHVTMNR